jgi:hypothetical protein
MNGTRTEFADPESRSHVSLSCESLWLCHCMWPSNPAGPHSIVVAVNSNIATNGRGTRTTL